MKFKTLNQLNAFINKYDPFEIGPREKESKYLTIINKHIKQDVVDKGKVLTPSKLNSLLMKLEDKYGWC